MAGKPLDLSSATGIEAIPSGWYDCHVERIQEVEIEGEDGKLPKGTEGYNVAFVVDAGEHEGAWLFNRYWMPTADEQPDTTKRNRMLGMFVSFLTAIGYAESDVKSGKYKFDAEDATDRKCRVLAGQREYDGMMQNTVRNVKPVGENLEESGLI